MYGLTIVLENAQLLHVQQKLRKSPRKEEKHIKETKQEITKHVEDARHANNRHCNV
jgi:hypothetical protein